MRLILADDSGVIRHALGEVCRKFGHDVEPVADGLQAWEAYNARRHEIVVLDWMMPVMDGLEVCRKIRDIDTDAQTYVIVVTSRASALDVSEVLEAGADDFMSKPVTADSLRARLQIGARRLAERDEHKAAVAALAHAQWLSGIGATTLALSHEINNPLQALLGEAQFLSEDLSMTCDQRLQTSVIIEQANRIATVVERLSNLRSPRTVEALPGLRMLDLSR